MSLPQISVLSTQYIDVDVSADVAGMAINPTADTVTMAFVAQGATPQPGDFKAASWAVSLGPPVVYSAQCLVGPSGVVSLAAGSTVDVYVKVFDNPETPVIRSGSLRVV